MIELYIYNRELTIVGEISEYESLEIERNYTSTSKLVLRVPKTPFYASLLKVGNIIVDKNEIDYGYIIEHFSAIKENSDIIEVYCYSLNHLLSYRSIQRQQRFYGDATEVLQNFVRYNCIEVASDRVIDNLTIGNNSDIGIYIDSTKTGDSVLEHCFSVANDVESSIDIRISNGGFVFNAWKGIDRSVEQQSNTRVTFSEEFDNVLSQSYFESYLNYKNVAVVAGEGEGIDRTVIEVNNNVSGLDRRELYVDARDLSRKYYDVDNNEVTLTEQEYTEILTQRGLEKLKEYNPIKSFETVVDEVQYIVGIDYFLGDKVTFIDNDLGILMNTRVTSIKTTSNRQGVIRMPSFGTGIPQLLSITEV